MRHADDDGENVSGLKSESKSESAKDLKLRLDAGITRIRRFYNAYRNFLVELDKLVTLIEEVKEVHVCRGCDEICDHIKSVLNEVKDIDPAVESLIFSAEAIDVMMEYNIVKPLEELTGVERKFIEEEVLSRIEEVDNDGEGTSDTVQG